MKIDDATAECKRWLAHMDEQRAKSIAMQRLASERRAGTCTDEEKDRRLRAIDRSVRVYDGAKLEQAVKALLRELARQRYERGRHGAKGRHRRVTSR